jgi:hypothetical protein
LGWPIGDEFEQFRTGRVPLNQRKQPVGHYAVVPTRQGTVNHKKFTGFDKDENGELIIDEKEAWIVRRIFAEDLGR